MNIDATVIVNALGIIFFLGAFWKITQPLRKFYDSFSEMQNTISHLSHKVDELSDSYSVLIEALLTIAQHLAEGNHTGELKAVHKKLIKQLSGTKQRRSSD